MGLLLSQRLIPSELEVLFLSLSDSFRPIPHSSSLFPTACMLLLHQPEFISLLEASSFNPKILIPGLSSNGMVLALCLLLLILS